MDGPFLHVVATLLDGSDCYDGGVDDPEVAVVSDDL